jgi:hypothetical protein
MLGLVDRHAEKTSRRNREYPDPVAAHILNLKQTYPPIHHQEIARIVERKFGYKTNHHTVKSFLDHYPIPIQLKLDLTRCQDVEAAYQAHWTVVRMWCEGWGQTSIAGCLKLSRKHVHESSGAHERDSFEGLEDERICGCRRMLIPDNGAVSKAQVYQDMAALHIVANHIDKGRRRPNLTIVQFGARLQLADFKFEQAKSLEEIEAIRTEFIDAPNTTAHWGHKDREDGRSTPVEVLDWVRGRAVDPAELQHACRQAWVAENGQTSLTRYQCAWDRRRQRQPCLLASYSTQSRFTRRTLPILTGRTPGTCAVRRVDRRGAHSPRSRPRRRCGNAWDT